MTFLTHAVMSTDVISIMEDHSIAEAEALMHSRHIRHLPVLNQKHELAGILSVKDLGKLHDRSASVKDIMTTSVRVVKKNANIKEVIETMLLNKISSVLVATAESIVGIVTTDDLLRLLSQVLEDNDDLESFEVGSFFDDSWSSYR